MGLTHAEDIARAVGKPVSPNLRSVVAGLDAMGDEAGLDRPHRLAHYLAQVAHESAGFHYDKEVWGPTAAQKRYEGRKDLGNTQPGDGKRFAGRGPIQITGRSNYRQFTAWCRERFPDAPDFEAHPELVNTDPWEGIGPIWYWSTRNLGALADDPACNIETITRRINGGLNGYADRRRYFTRIALVMLGYGPTQIKQFQTAAGLKADGISGQLTERALQARLMALPAKAWPPAAPAPPVQPVPAAPPPSTVEVALAAQAKRIDGLERRINELEGQKRYASSAGRD